ncbi:hypothetical protein JHL18_04245 [Clostridium sp. YIM B02505]|uniref:SGNH hydrolase-type esterase domain-containing protein n=1 Tax=Clostridium yunnanense TaxID=2800325 RepID=A0ABS1EKG5_9CLOT|nr:SGNH/GDSL hydrolase family protein [Clostridium yunnanense]MBK1809850.1 hypothetical protein [Clostridium yunnanense]
MTKIKEIHMDNYTYLDNVFSFEGAVSVEENNEYCAPWRIDFKEKELFPVLKDKVGKFCSGVRLCFTTNAQYIALQMAEIDEDTLILDVFVEGAFNQQIKISDTSPIALEGLREGTKQIEIWLTQNQTFKLKKLFINKGAKISKTLDYRKRWIHYGSSISQSNAATSPSKTWAAMTAQKLNLNLTNLGFSGECVFDPMVGMKMRDLEADYITLKLGINTYPGLQTERMFAPNVIGIIKSIRERHPYTPLAIISPIYCEAREIEKGACGLSLTEMRVSLEQIVNIFKSYGDRNIFYISGLEILNEESKQHLPDGLHPDADAQYIMSDNFTNKVFSRMAGTL